MGFDYNKFNAGAGWKFERIRETYTATPGGGFRKKPDEITTEIVDGAFYINFIRAIPFFNNQYYGETCRAAWNYTPAGYIPTRVITSKKGYKKHIDTFNPIL